MYDTALNNQFPAGAAAYAAYVDGGVGNQPNYAYIVSAFPKAQHLAIALFASDNADALDVEPGASAPSDIPGWFATCSTATRGCSAWPSINPSKTGVVSVRRNDAGNQAVGYVIY